MCCLAGQYCITGGHDDRLCVWDNTGKVVKVDDSQKVRTTVATSFLCDDEKLFQFLKIQMKNPLHEIHLKNVGCFPSVCQELISRFLCCNRGRVET